MIDQQIHKGVHVFGVCDGHGIFGDLVSLFIRKNYPEILRKHLREADLADVSKVTPLLVDSFLELDLRLKDSSVDDS